MEFNTTTNGWDIAVQNGLHSCESDGLQYLSYPPQWKCKHCGKFYVINTMDNYKFPPRDNINK